MTTDDGYRPIDCDQHSILELLAMRRTTVGARARDAAGVVFGLDAVVFDVVTRDSAEYLMLRDTVGKVYQIRLDRLLSLHAPSGGLLWRQETVVS
ncbi:MAG: transcriptional antiterminator, Rof [Chromatiaceae bacterium]|nr:transcriptional antiterminator, Rof [Chromatiaceae bacterium]